MFWPSYGFGGSLGACRSRPELVLTVQSDLSIGKNFEFPKGYISRDTLNPRLFLLYLHLPPSRRLSPSSHFRYAFIVSHRSVFSALFRLADAARTARARGLGFGSDDVPKKADERRANLRLSSSCIALFTSGHTADVPRTQSSKKWERRRPTLTSSVRSALSLARVHRSDYPQSSDTSIPASPLLLVT